jgi:hypothetical protein
MILKDQKNITTLTTLQDGLLLASGCFQYDTNIKMLLSKQHSMFRVFEKEIVSGKSYNDILV